MADETTEGVAGVNRESMIDALYEQWKAESGHASRAEAARHVDRAGAWIYARMHEVRGVVLGWCTTRDR